jgi:hypothetical protein
MKTVRSLPRTLGFAVAAKRSCPAASSLPTTCQYSPLCSARIVTGSRCGSASDDADGGREAGAAAAAGNGEDGAIIIAFGVASARGRLA